MPAALQKTKLFLPAARDALILRPRLLQRLEALRAPEARLLLISAPAGSGKTTLAAQWLRGAGWGVGWVSLDERDNQPASFFAYCIAALQQVVPGAGGEALALLELPGVNLDEVVTLLVNDLVEAPGPFALALDDFQAITNPALHRAVDRWVEALPASMRLILLSREDPAINLSRRRAHAHLVELRQEDLRFTVAETREFLRESMQLDLQEGQVESLEARTEGWIAGLQMAALSLQRTPDPAGFIRDFNGTHRFVLDYLMEEVLSRQPVETQDFLLKTALVERLNAGLCAALTGLSSAQAQSALEQLARSNLFIIPLDEERQWYRYHHLFGALLLARMQARGGAELAPLYRKAAAWYDGSGDARLAVECAFKAQDDRLAADLIERHMAARWQQADMEFFRLTNRLPVEITAQRPSLCLHAAWIALVLGQIERIQPLLEQAERILNDTTLPPAPGEAVNRAFARVLRIHLDDLHNRPVALDESFHQILAAIPDTYTGMRNSAAVVLGSACFMEGDLESARRYFGEALERDRRVQGTNAVPIASMRLSWVWMAQGRLGEAMRQLREQELYARERGIRRFYISGALNLLQGEILLEWNDLEGAEAQIREGLRLLEDWPSPPILGFGLSLLAQGQTLRGDLDGAQAGLAKARALQQQTRFHPYLANALDRAQLALWLACGERQALAEWADRQVVPVDAALTFRAEGSLLNLCRAWLALGRENEARQVLDALYAQADRRDGSRVAILALLAGACSGDMPRALYLVGEVLRRAEPGGYVRTFVQAGPGFSRCLAAWLQQPGQPASLRAYARRVLAACAPAALQPAPESLLSERELEVLKLAAGGLTNQQIADRLVISIRTVKKHVENIHGKLGVDNRTQAAARARELNLLDD